MNPPPWPGGKRACVSLTYDDALPRHFREVAPALEERRMRGTFYVPIASPLLDDWESWREVAARGHELGNHTIFHPCRKGGNLHPWLDDGLDLRDYSLNRLRQELETANKILTLADGKTRRSYGNTCGDLTVGREGAETPMEPVVRDLFVAARGRPRSDRSPARPGPALDFHDIGYVQGDNRTMVQFEVDLAEALRVGGWLIYTFHDVAPEPGRAAVERPEHERLLDFLAREENGFWVSPVAEAALRLRGS